MDAKHFRTRAAKAREMARAGDDVRLAEMLLEVANDLEAEAEAIEAEQRGATPLLTNIMRPTLPWQWGLASATCDAAPVVSVPGNERLS